MTLTLPTTSRLWVAVALAALLAAHADAQPKADVNEATEKAMKAASAKVAPSIVKIETAGGTELIKEKEDPKKKGGAPPGTRKGVGPTTGLIVSPDGYVITSSFNFANRPTDIFVTV